MRCRVFRFRVALWPGIVDRDPLQAISRRLAAARNRRDHFLQQRCAKQTAEKVRQRWDKSGEFKRPVVTEITSATKFYSAEEYHQKYLVKNPGGYTCHVLRHVGG